MNGTATFHTGMFNSIGSLSDLDILGLYGTSPTQPEKKLMLAILLDAVECFQKYAGHEANRLFKDTDEWIFADDPEWFFSFINICEAVGMDPQYLRKGLSHWRKKSQKPIRAGNKLPSPETRSNVLPKFIYQSHRGRVKTNLKLKSSRKRHPNARSKPRQSTSVGI